MAHEWPAALLPPLALFILENRKLSNMNVSIKVEIDIDKSEPEFCGSNCRFLQEDTEGDDYCWLFGIILLSRKRKIYIENDFALRCSECIKVKEIKLKKKVK